VDNGLGVFVPRDRNLPTPVHEIDSSPPDSIEDEDDDEHEDEQPPLTSHFSRA
jgi:hypothetical protein